MTTRRIRVAALVLVVAALVGSAAARATPPPGGDTTTQTQTGSNNSSVDQSANANAIAVTYTGDICRNVTGDCTVTINNVADATALNTSNVQQLVCQSQANGAEAVAACEQNIVIVFWSDVPGPQGPAGQDGSNGSNGSNGATGPQGPAGPTGATGPQGPEPNICLNWPRDGKHDNPAEIMAIVGVPIVLWPTRTGLACVRLSYALAHAPKPRVIVKVKVVKVTTKDPACPAGFKVYKGHCAVPGDG